MSMLWESNLAERVALGLVPGWESWRKFGMNDGVPNTGQEEMWPVGTVRVLPSVAAVVSVSSDSVEDDTDKGGAVPGTGLWTMRIYGLDANYREITEEVTMNGTAAVTTTASFLRINRMYALTAGTSFVNVGNITATIGGATQAYIEATEGQTHQTHFTVPADHTVLVTGLTAGVGRMGGSSDLHIQSEVKLVGVDGANAAWRTVSDIYLFNGGAIHQNLGSVTLIPEKTEMRQLITSTSATQAYSVLQGYLIHKTAQFQV